MTESTNQLPERIRKRLTETKQNIEKVIQIAEATQTARIQGKIGFQYESRVPNRGIFVLKDFEVAQTICFIAKYENLPVLESYEIFEDKGNYYLKNLDYIRYVLSEYRPIIANKKDSVYYNKIHKFCREKLVNRDTRKDLVITAVGCLKMPCSGHL